ncbi:MAG: hypothetical protein ACI9MS_003368, partial [Glaciecola sp.]
GVINDWLNDWFEVQQPIKVSNLNGCLWQIFFTHI